MVQHKWFDYFKRWANNLALTRSRTAAFAPVTSRTRNTVTQKKRRPPPPSSGPTSGTAPSTQPTHQSTHQSWNLFRTSGMHSSRKNCQRESSTTSCCQRRTRCCRDVLGRRTPSAKSTTTWVQTWMRITWTTTTTTAPTRPCWQSETKVRWMSTLMIFRHPTIALTSATVPAWRLQPSPIN